MNNFYVYLDKLFKSAGIDLEQSLGLSNLEPKTKSLIYERLSKIFISILLSKLTEDLTGEEEKKVELMVNNLSPDNLEPLWEFINNKYGDEVEMFWNIVLGETKKVIEEIIQDHRKLMDNIGDLVNN